MFAHLAKSVALGHPSSGISLISLHSLWQSRRQLRSLDARRLQDIGLTEAEQMTESRRPVWDVPAHWRR